MDGLVGESVLFVLVRVSMGKFVREEATYSISLSITLVSSIFDGVHPETKKKR